MGARTSGTRSRRSDDERAIASRWYLVLGKDAERGAIGSSSGDRSEDALGAERALSMRKNSELSR